MRFWEAVRRQKLKLFEKSQKMRMMRRRSRRTRRTKNFPPKWGSIDAIDDSFGKCSSKVIIFGGVEIKMVDFGGV